MVFLERIPDPLRRLASYVLFPIGSIMLCSFRIFHADSIQAQIWMVINGGIFCMAVFIGAITSDPSRGNILKWTGMLMLIVLLSILYAPLFTKVSYLSYVSTNQESLRGIAKTLIAQDEPTMRLDFRNPQSVSGLRKGSNEDTMFNQKSDLTRIAFHQRFLDSKLIYKVNDERIFFGTLGPKRGVWLVYGDSTFKNLKKLDGNWYYQTRFSLD